jgi:Fur family peroxide stress response transcriptional regulator
MDLFRKKCRENGLRITPQRTAIYKELREAKDHPSVEAVFRRVRNSIPDISFDTVYRTLQSFTEIGVVNLVEGYGGPKRFDTDIDNHHHMRCMRCDRIIDFRSEEYDKIKIPEGIDNRFQVLNKKVVLEGICGKCRGGD